jgi:phosphoribosylformylglycinamidine synthase
MRFHALVEVRLRAGIADPQGATIERALPALGFEGVEGVRVGKAIRFDVDASDEAAARAEIDELCRRLLANPVIEDADISISPAQGSITTGGRTG